MSPSDFEHPILHSLEGTKALLNWSKTEMLLSSIHASPIAEKTAYQFAYEGKLPSCKVESAWQFRKSEIDRWINEQAQNKEDKA